MRSERPILFSGPMVCAILEGRKTQTRRVMRPQPWLHGGHWFLDRSDDGYGRTNACWRNGDEPFWTYCPHGAVEDRLWVRETFCLENNAEYYGDPEFAPPKDGRPIKHHKAANEYDSPFDLIPRYRATEPDTDLCCEHEKCQGGPCSHPWRPSIFMPRWASRITLEITDVCVQRLQEISEEDAKAEGLHVQIGDAKAGHCWDGPGYHDHVSRDQFGRTYHVPRGEFCCCHAGQELKLTAARCAFRILWQSINAKRGFGWETNPWVWALTFKRI